MSVRITTVCQPCPDRIRDLLVETAYHMLEQHMRRETFCTELCFGVIETDFQIAIDQGAAGIEFFVQAHGEKGLIEFSFLVRAEEALRCKRLYYSVPSYN